MFDANEITVVNNSYGRCLSNKVDNKTFLDAFYDAFLESGPQVKPLFANTDFSKQKNLLKQGLSMMIMVGSDSEFAKSMIAKLATRHDHTHLNISPDLYRLWEQSLLSTIEKFDNEFNPELKKVWFKFITHTTEIMKKAY